MRKDKEIMSNYNMHCWLFDLSIIYGFTFENNGRRYSNSYLKSKTK